MTRDDLITALKLMAGDCEKFGRPEMRCVLLVVAGSMIAGCEQQLLAAMTDFASTQMRAWERSERN